ncbi:hypothetical protein FHG87_023022 [Trinorchestia longiramus]|nr:hypothetical protein FHG87_023022 [Trinorchestia longiramus]
MVDAARNTAWDLGKQPNNYQSNYPTQEWARSAQPTTLYNEAATPCVTLIAISHHKKHEVHIDGSPLPYDKSGKVLGLHLSSQGYTSHRGKQ